ncbi:uncharacterized protein CLUP02_04149 [Colletotrichum lupini]|uniref:Uncharacterized protein n=1 Tax=Colletotrichum lupini TaxID=145971 RepID=A0A9Q8SJS7_9PEZI|nr:uncharacterized protein CLUP02_04149 [Colletotrichum lupini]UQC78672.1 hypothetical protein CLUP02_04149 [Colletotrichum lupini]
MSNNESKGWLNCIEGGHGPSGRSRENLTSRNLTVGLMERLFDDGSLYSKCDSVIGGEKREKSSDMAKSQRFMESLGERRCLTARECIVDRDSERLSRLLSNPRRSQVPTDDDNKLKKHKLKTTLSRDPVTTHDHDVFLSEQAQIDKLQSKSLSFYRGRGPSVAKSIATTNFSFAEFFVNVLRFVANDCNHQIDHLSSVNESLDGETGCQ